MLGWSRVNCGFWHGLRWKNWGGGRSRTWLNSWILMRVGLKTGPLIFPNVGRCVDGNPTWFLGHRVHQEWKSQHWIISAYGVLNWGYCIPNIPKYHDLVLQQPWWLGDPPFLGKNGAKILVFHRQFKSRRGQSMDWLQGFFFTGNHGFLPRWSWGSNRFRCEPGYYISFLKSLALRLNQETVKQLGNGADQRDLVMGCKDVPSIQKCWVKDAFNLRDAHFYWRIYCTFPLIPILSHWNLIKIRSTPIKSLFIEG